MKAVLKSCGGRLACFAVGIALGQLAAVPSVSAASATASGPSALALATVVALSSAVHSSYDKRSLVRLFAGDSNISFPPSRKISVNVDFIVCRVSNVDITARSCDLTFRTGKRTLKAREANELYATLAVAGIVAQGAAGSMIEGVTKLECTVDPAAIRQKDGGGAKCTFTTGQ